MRITSVLQAIHFHIAVCTAGIAVMAVLEEFVVALSHVVEVSPFLELVHMLLLRCSTH